jgi:uncharacterized membrane protein
VIFLIKRLKNKYFLFALAGFLYQLLKLFGVEVDDALWQVGLDLISYILIGSGIYQTFEEKKGDK